MLPVTLQVRALTHEFQRDKHSFHNICTSFYILLLTQWRVPAIINTFLLNELILISYISMIVAMYIVQGRENRASHLTSQPQFLQMLNLDKNVLLRGML